LDLNGPSGFQGIYNSHVPKPTAKAVWKALATVGVSATFIGLTVYGLDFVTVGEFSFIADHFEIFLFAILIGVALLVVGLIGWAATLGKAGRKRIAFLAFILPLTVIAIGYAMGGTNVHGLFFLFLLAMAPMIVVALVVAIMAVSTQRT
jgi:hypothetical protein